MRRTNHVRRTNRPSNICGDYGYVRADGEPCGNWVTPGTHTCRRHAGKSLPEQQRIGQAAQAATITLNKWGLLPDEWIDPTETFLKLISLSARRVSMYADLLNAIELRGITGDVAWRAEGDPDEPAEDHEDHEDHAMRVGLTSGQLALYKTLIGNVYTMSKTGQLYITHEDHRALITLEGQERDRLAKLCAEAQKLKIEERRIQLAEETGGKIATVVRRMLDDLNLTPEQMAEAGPAFRRALSAVFNQGANILEGTTG